MPELTITECELHAYVDDQLDSMGRLEVADYLVRNPDVAARVLADLSVREAMRALAQRDEQPVLQRLHDSARKVEGALHRSRLFRRLSGGLAMAAGIIAAVALGVGKLDMGVAPTAQAMPVFIEEALMSHKTALVRSHMKSQPEIPHFDPADVRTATHINVPVLPAGWRVLDVQLFPSDYGPSLQLVIDAGEKAPVSLFAARAVTGLPETPRTQVVDGENIAYWARKGTVYVLTGVESQDFLQKHAADLADNQDA